MDPKQIDLLKRIREEDEKGAKGENEALNSRRLEKYVREVAHIDADNFDEKFTVETALGYLRSSPSRGEAMLLKELDSAQNYMKAIGLPKLFDNENSHIFKPELIKSPGTFESELHAELVKRQAEHREEDLLAIYEKYQLIKQLARRKIMVKERFMEERKEEMNVIGESITDQVKDTVKEVRKNFGKMSGKEKLLAVGGMILGTVLLYNAAKDNDTVKKIKDGLWTAIKYTGAAAGIGVTVNYAYKLFTGKTALTALEEYTASTTGSDGFWAKTFETEPDKGDILRDSMVYLGDKKFNELARRYREARGARVERIEMISVDKDDMTPEQIYQALDVFFSRYDIDKTEEDFKDYKPPILWENAVAAKLAEDGSIAFKGNLWERIKNTVDEGYTKSVNWLVAGEGFGVMKGLYQKYYGKEDVSDDVVRRWTKDIFEGNEIQKESELAEHIDRKFNKLHQKGYKEVAKNGTFDKKTGAKYYSEAGGSIYVMTKVNLENAGGDSESAKKAFMKAEESGTAFLRDRFPQVADNIYKFMNIEGGARIAESSSFVLFMRMPLPGTADFEKANNGLEWRNVPQRRDIDVFGPKNKIEYKSLKEWDQQQLRLHFLLDASQKDDLDKICRWFTDKYKGENRSMKYVMDRLLTSEDDKTEALRQTGVTQKLAANLHLLESLEKELGEVEDDAADELKDEGDHDMAIELMKRRKGYDVRLALAGDSKAMKTLNFDPRAEDARETLIDDYKKWCEKAVENRNNGAL